MFHFWLIISITFFLVINQIYAAVSYNQPKFCSNATWNKDATTLADSSILSSNCEFFFIDVNNTVYAVDSGNQRVHVWVQGNSPPERAGFDNLNSPRALFVTITGDIYVDNSNYQQIEKSSLTAAGSTVVMSVTGQCTGLFIDLNDNIYCSLSASHIVIKKSLNAPMGDSPTTVAGVASTSGSSSNELNEPFGIFVDTNFDLYVADRKNNRIQLFQSGQSSATTVTINGAQGTMSLNEPTGVFLDADKYLFIVEYGNNHVIGSDANGFRCIVGCTGSGGSGSDTLRYPRSLSFDSYGNLFVFDTYNDRIQKFDFLTNSCKGNSGIQQTTASTQKESTMHMRTTEDVFTSSSSTSVRQESTTDNIITTSESLSTTSSSVLQQQLTTEMVLIESTSANSISHEPSSTENVPTEGTLLSSSFISILEQSTMKMTTAGSVSPSLSASIVPQGSTIPVDSESTSTEIIPTEGTLLPSSLVSILEQSTMKMTTTKSTSTSLSTSIVPQKSTTTSENLSQLTSTKTPILHQNCSSLKIQFISKQSNSSTTEYKLNENIYISSNIKFHCQEFYSITYQWLISNSTIFNISNDKIQTTFNEIYIPSNILTLGIYELKLIITVNTSSSIFTTFESISIKIIQSKKLIVNLIEFGASKITVGVNQEVLIEPGKYSFYDDQTPIIENEWNFEYYCRIYNSNRSESFAQITNSSCFSNSNWELNQINSSLKIFPSSLKTNQTYQFMVQINHRQNSSVNYRGYLLVYIQNAFSHRISIRCVISTMCVFDDDNEYQLINPHTQVSLYSECSDNCSFEMPGIHWNIHQGRMNFSTNVVQWIEWNQPSILTYGNNTNHLTVSKNLFTNNPTIDYWKFEAIYLFPTGISSSSIHFKKPVLSLNGNCSINPQNGTTKTLFNIICSNWFDENDIRDYTVYVWTNGYSKRIMIGFSLVSTFSIRLPCINSSININIQIRNKDNYIKQFNITSINVYDDMENFKNETNILIGNQNDIEQTIISISQKLEKNNNEHLNKILANNMSITRMAISSLDSPISISESSRQNESLLEEYSEQLNNYANIREYLINFTSNLIIADSNSIILQASSLVQLTKATNQLTRLTLMIATMKCYQLAVKLNELAQEISFEDIQQAVTLLSQCTSNILNSINGPLQERTNLLKTDLLHFEQLFYDNKEEYFNDQKDFINKITSQINETISFLTLALNQHLNIDQKFTINTPEVYIFFEKLSNNYPSNEQIQLIENSQINIPLNFNQTILIQSKLDVLAPYGNYLAYTNFSRSLTFSILNENGNEIPLTTNNSIEFIIPRDPNLMIPKMILQNVTNYTRSFDYKLIDLKQLKLNRNLTISIHFEIEPFNLSLGYLFVYQFDKQHQFTNPPEIFCPSKLTNENIYQYYINNQRVADHQSILFGIRELTSEEFEYICINNSTENLLIQNPKSYFTSNYKLRIYSSACYYLDQYHNWQSNGLLVGSKTNLKQTHCFVNRF